MADDPRIGVIGAGAWGTALALAAARAGRPVSLWMRDGAEAARLAGSRMSRSLPDTILPEAIRPTSDLARAADADILILAPPAQALRAVALALRAHLAAGTPVIVAAKGIERGTHAFMTDIIAEAVPQARPLILSGPGFAADVARGSPTAETLAARDGALAASMAAALGSPQFRIYHSADVRGVEIGGAAKNVLAIAAGVAAGKGFGESAVAALIARGFAELARLGEALGAKPETLAGLSGLGDLILTGTSRQSRNRRLGEAMGRGASVRAAVAEVGLAEGAWTAQALAAIAGRYGVEMPVSQAVAALVDGTVSVDAVIEQLLSRPLRSEG